MKTENEGQVRKARVAEVELTPYGDSRGQLMPLEAGVGEVPFEVKRVYYIFDTTPGTIRGKHAHRTLRQLLVCVSGACTIDCELPDGTRSTHRLDWPTKGLLIDGLVWREMREFSKDAVLMVLASEHYDPSDYIRNHDEFIRQ